MDIQTEQVFKGFLGLTPTQRRDLIEAINSYNKETVTIQKQLEERYIKRVDLGPLSSNVCKCCGR